MGLLHTPRKRKKRKEKIYMSEVSSETCDSSLTANVTNINFLFFPIMHNTGLPVEIFYGNMQVYFASKPSCNFWHFVARSFGIVIANQTTVN